MADVDAGCTRSGRAPRNLPHVSLFWRLFLGTVVTLLVFVLGGMTNFVAIMLGGIVIGVAEAIGTIYMTHTLGQLLPYLIFVAIMLFRPQGLVWRS